MKSKIIFLLINLTLFGLFGWGTVQQITNQQKTNQVMAEVHQNIQEAHRLTVVTNQQLKPLHQTVNTITQMNNKLENTRGRLMRMNGSLHWVTQSEQKIVTGLELLNGHTSTVSNQLNQLQEINQQLVPESTEVAKQTSTENTYLKKLSGLTHTSIQELTRLNQKLIWLSYLP